MIVKVHGRDHRDGDNLGIRYRCQFVTAMVEPLQQDVDQDKGGYNPAAGTYGRQQAIKVLISPPFWRIKDCQGRRSMAHRKRYWRC